MPVEDLHI